MKRRYHSWRFWALSGILIGITLPLVHSASAQAPSIEGTYKLVSRTLPDGTVLEPPRIIGLLIYTKTHRSFSDVFQDPTGKFRSFSLASTYELTANEYRETLLFSVLNDQVGGKDAVYELSGRSESVPVTTEDGRIEFDPPLDRPGIVFVFEGNTLTASLEGEFVDRWEKVP